MSLVVKSDEANTYSLLFFYSSLRNLCVELNTGVPILISTPKKLFVHLKVKPRYV